MARSPGRAVLGPRLPVTIRTPVTATIFSLTRPVRPRRGHRSILWSTFGAFLDDPAGRLCGRIRESAPILDMLEWVKKRAERPADSGSESAPEDGLLPDLRAADPVTALNELRAWLEPAGAAALADLKARGELLAQVQDAGAAHVAVLLAQYLASAPGKQVTREAAWKSLIQYQARLTHALGQCAKALLGAAYEDASLLAPAEAATARALHGCRALVKICLVHYASVPGSVWSLAYALHARAEEIGSAASPVKAEADQRKGTTVEQEFLRLLMLQVSAPDMMAPEQIEVADRVLEQIGDGLTLRAPGVADNPFCFDAQGDLPPLRASGAQAGPGSATRYFGSGMGFDALERIHKQMSVARIEDIKVFGNDISPLAQLSTIQHLLSFWRAKSPYAPQARSPATGSLHLVYRYAQVWKNLSDAQLGARELALADESDSAPVVSESWTLREAGGSEFGAELAQPGSGATKCGDIVGMTLDGANECWVGVIRRVQCEPGGSLHADIAVLSRKPQALSLREVLKKGEDSVVSEAASRQFAFSSVRAVILADGTDGAQPANLLLPAESWSEGRIYETTDTPARYLRGLKAIRLGDDYVRATFKWVSAPD